MEKIFQENFQEKMKVTMKDGSVAELDFETEEGRRAFRHTAAHILAQAVKRLYPSAKCAIGPAIADGFYYDFDFDFDFSEKNLAEIEKEMQKIVRENLPLHRYTLSRADALSQMARQNEPYKVQLIEDLPEDAPLSFYAQGEYTDLCAGPHVSDTGVIKAFKLTGIAGAYWRGNEKNRMLTRIYGTAFPTDAAVSWQQK